MLSNLDISKAMTIKLDDKLPKCLNLQKEQEKGTEKRAWLKLNDL